MVLIPNGNIGLKDEYGEGKYGCLEMIISLLVLIGFIILTLSLQN